MHQIRKLIMRAINGSILHGIYNKTANSIKYHSSYNTSFYQIFSSVLINYLVFLTYKSGNSDMLISAIIDVQK